MTKTKQTETGNSRKINMNNTKIYQRDKKKLGLKKVHVNAKKNHWGDGITIPVK